MSNYPTNPGQSSNVNLVDITNKNISIYKDFENHFSNLSQFLSRIYPDTDSVIKWCYINVDGKNIGSIWLETVDNGVAKLGVFIADEKYRNKGYGTDAINKMLSFAENNGCKILRLNVRTSNIRAFKVYRNLGFNEIKRYTKDNGVDVIQMEKYTEVRN